MSDRKVPAYRFAVPDQCGAMVPEPGQWNLKKPLLVRCRYRAQPHAPYCSIHAKAAKRQALVQR